MKTRILLCLAATLIAAFLSGCGIPEPISEIDKYLEELNSEERFSGAVLIAKDGEPIFQEAYGIANRNYDVPNQIDTKFNLGSMNKMFTAVAVLQLVEQGKIAVEDRIIDHVPAYPNQEAANLVTIHQLLTHSSGLSFMDTQKFSETSKDLYQEIKDYLPLFADKPLLFEPGTQSYYSNSGYVVLGIIIEETTGQSYYDYVMENIYQPCGMAETDSFETDRVVPNIAVGYAGNLRNYGELSSNWYALPFKGIPAGGGYSTVGDMLKFSSCLLNHQLLSPDMTEMLLEPKVSSPIPGMDGEYAYGFSVGRIHNHRVVGHGGSLPGVCSILNMYVDLGYAVVVLSNSSNDCLRVIINIQEALLD